MAQINKPDEYFTSNLHTGTGSSQNITTGLNMSANGGLVWNKVRSTSNNHVFCDTIRGATKLLYPDLTAAEQTEANSITSFNSDGWTGGGSGNTNGSGQTFVSWNWLAGSSPSGVANTDGSISSTVSANTTSGFSIVSYTGTGANATVGHGLGVAPSMIIVKNRDNGTPHWPVYHKSLGATKWVYLSATDASDTATPMWNATEPTSSVFSLGTWNNGNGSSENMIAYCFAEKKGFSKFGSYTGNGNADGTFVYTGFKPAFVIIKRTSGADNWLMWDNKRNTSNATVNTLRPNTSEVENTSAYPIDFLSNGFKNRGTSGHHNTSGQTYIYMCFAENPLVGTNNIPAVAR